MIFLLKANDKYWARNGKSHRENFGDYIWLTIASVVCGERLHPVPVILTGTFGPIIIDGAILGIFCGVSTGRAVSGRASNVSRTLLPLRTARTSKGV
jgi:hypothetical protein